MKYTLLWSIFRILLHKMLNIYRMFSFNQTKEFLFIIKELKPKKSTGSSNLSAYICKDLAEYLAGKIAHILSH